MNLITAAGLNCYYSCIASIADYFGIDYRAGCGRLWSEKDFSYDPKHRIYLTARFIADLEILGLKLRRWHTASPQETAARIAGIRRDRDVLLIGMDAFYLPWSAVYRQRRGLHYFFGMKADEERLVCFDPLYQAKYVSLPHAYIAAHSFDIRCVQKSDPRPLIADLRLEAEAILGQHSSLLISLKEQARPMEGKPLEERLMPAKYIDSLRNNRLLFQGFLRTRDSLQEVPSAFTPGLFAKWAAVKNGLYKMAIVSNSADIFPSLCGSLEELIAEETAIAVRLADASMYI